MQYKIAMSRLLAALLLILASPAMAQTVEGRASVIDGEHVFVDINDYEVRPGDRAVIVDHAGAISISAVDPESYGFKPMGPRSALGPRYPTSHGGIAIISSCSAIAPSTMSRVVGWPNNP